jgi:hypothetical protein
MKHPLRMVGVGKKITSFPQATEEGIKYKIVAKQK